jgi:hypothetical protein
VSKRAVWSDRLRRCLAPGHRPGFVLLAVLLVATGGGALVAATSGTGPAARVLALGFVGTALAWSVPVWLQRAQEHQLYEELAALESQGIQAVAILILWAVADGRDAVPAIMDHLDSAADVEPVLDRLERARLVLGEWIERPGHVTIRRYRLTPTGHRLVTRTLRS